MFHFRQTENQSDFMKQLSRAKDELFTKRLDSPCHTTRGFLKFSGDIEGNRRHEIGYTGPFGRPSFTLSDWNYFISIDILLKLVLEEPTQQSILVYNQQWKH